MIGSMTTKIFKQHSFPETQRFYLKQQHRHNLQQELSILQETLKPKLKITIVTETWSPEINGVANSLLQLCKGLQKLGHRIQLIRPIQKTICTDFKAEQECLVWAKSIPKYADMQFGMPQYVKVSKAIERFAPDVVHIVTEGPLGLTALYAAQAHQIPVSSGFHSTFHDFSRFFDLALLVKPIESYLRWFHNHTVLTCVPSQTTLNQLQAFGVTCPLVEVGRGVDTTRFHPEHRSEQLRQRWQADANTTVLLYVGRLSPEKEVDVLIQSYLNIKKQQSRKLKMVIVGDGPDRKRLTEIANGSDVIFTGSLTGQLLAQAYASADAFVFASQIETFGNVVLEAMASGLPVVAYNYASPQRYIKQGITGWLSPFGQVAHFMQTIIQLPEQKVLRCMGTQARQDIESVGWQYPVKQFEQALYHAANIKAVP